MFARRRAHRTGRSPAADLGLVEVLAGQRWRIGGVSKVSGSWRSAMQAAAVVGLTVCRLAVVLRRKG